LLGHVTDDREDGETGKETGTGIDSTDTERLLVDVVVVLVIATQGNQRTHSETVGEKDLSHSIDPYTGFVKFVQFRSEVEGDAFSSTVESDTADEQHRQQEVREECREVNHFASAFDTLPDTEVADDPDERQRSYQLPAKSSDHFQSVRDFQYSISALRIVQLSILIIKS